MDENCSRWKIIIRNVKIKINSNEKKNQLKIIKLRIIKKRFKRIYFKWYKKIV